MDGSSKKIISNSVILMGAELFRKLLRMVLVISAARILGDDLYGQFAWGMGFTMLFWILADMGIHQLLIREIARQPAKVKEYLANGLAIKLLLSAGTIILLIIAIRITGRPPEVVRTTIILAGSLILMSFLELFKSIFQASQRMIYDAAVTILETLLIVGGGLLVLFRGGGIESLACIYCAAFGITLLCAVGITIRRFTPVTLEWDSALVRHLFKEGFPIGINHFFAMVYTHVDTTMLGLMINDEVVAWYNAAFRLRFAMQFIGASIVKAVYPPLSRAYHESKEAFEAIFQKTFKVMLLIGISLAVSVSLVAEKIIDLLYGGEYSHATEILQIMVWALVLVFLNLLMAHTTRASDRQRFTARVVAFAAFFNVGMNALLIPKYSYMGAAVATLATEGVTVVSHLYYLSKNLVKPPLFSLLPVVVLINLPGAAFLRFVPAPLLLQIPAVLIMITLMTLMMRYFSRDEIAFIKTLLRFRNAGNTVPNDESDTNQRSGGQE